MNEWGWRIPFILGGLIAVIAYSIRSKTTETKYFKKMQGTVKNNPVKLLFTKNYANLIKGIAIMLFPSCFILFFLTLPVYLMDIYNYKSTDVYFYITISYLFTIVLLPFFGWLSDKIGRKILFITVIIIFIISCFFFFNLLNIKGNLSLFIFLLFYQFTISAMALSPNAKANELIFLFR
jgi:MHS family proline/betaine transporter-like MFS transporter